MTTQLGPPHSTDTTGVHSSQWAPAGSDQQVPSSGSPGALWITAVRFLCRRLHVRRGLGGAIMRLAEHLNALQLLPVPIDDGRILHLDLRQPVTIPYLLFGELVHEPGETVLVRSLIRPGDVVWDVGANVGWYSTLFARLVRPEGLVFAFEPGLEALRMLRASLAEQQPPARIVSKALGDYQGEACLQVPADLGNASLRNTPDTRHGQACRITTVDDFVREEPSSLPTFIKCDVEGGEKAVLAGASRVLSGPRPPMWLIEMNADASARFGHRPEDLTEILLDHREADYWGHRVDQQTGRLLPLPEEPRQVFNALFVPRWLRCRVAAHQERSGLWNPHQQ